MDDETPQNDENEAIEPDGGTTELGVEHGEHADFSFGAKLSPTDHVRHGWRRPIWGAVAGGLALLLVLGFVMRSGADGADEDFVTDHQREVAGLPSFVIINSDDQRWDSLQYMPNVRELLVKRGITFTNSFTVNPVCCPSRAALMTGTYSHTNGVYDNKGAAGGFFAFNDGGSLGTFMDVDYSTGLFGKYLNNYFLAAKRGYVPRGWDAWHAFDRQGYYDFALNENGELHSFSGKGPNDYSINVLTDRITSFIKGTDGPLLVYYTPPTPHLPATPLPEDAKKFDGIPKWRPASYNEADVGDKPDYIQRSSSFDAAETEKIDDIRIAQLRSLQALDRSVAEIVQTLEATGRLDNTMIIYTSDNGFMWGEHRLKGKNVPYEESIRVPLVVRYDPWITKPREDDHLIANIDIAPTIVDMAGAEAYKPDGESMVPLLRGRQDAPWRDAFLIEHYAEKSGQKVPTFCAVRTDRYKLVDYFWGKDELYDLAKDPRELENRIFDGSLAGVKADLERKLEDLCKPRPPESVDQLIDVSG